MGIILGDQVHSTGGRTPFFIPDDVRNRHLYVVGKTGMGKSGLLYNLLLQDIHAGRGCALIDPHGDLAEDILKAIPPSLYRKVVLFNPLDDRPVGLNPFKRHGLKDEETLLADEIIGSLKSRWKDSWGPRMENILRHCLFTLLHYPPATLLDVNRLLDDYRFRQSILRGDKDLHLKGIKDKGILAFWRHYDKDLTKQQRADWTEPVRNKIGTLTLSPLTKYVLGQPVPRSDFRFIMDNQRIFIASLPKGKLGEETSYLLGSLIVSGFHFAALSRADIEEQDRVSFYLYADEFQFVVTPSFASMLPEDRKYGLHLTLAHQSTSQLTEEVRDAIFANVGTILAFQLGYTDRQLLLPILYPYNLEHFRYLERFHAFVNMDEEVSRLEARKPRKVDYGKRGVLNRVSRERYGVPRGAIDARLQQWQQVNL
jgi:hypothetical protein